MDEHEKYLLALKWLKLIWGMLPWGAAVGAMSEDWELKLLLKDSNELVK